MKDFTQDLMQSLQQGKTSLEQQRAASLRHDILRILQRRFALSAEDTSQLHEALTALPLEKLSLAQAQAINSANLIIFEAWLASNAA